MTERYDFHLYRLPGYEGQPAQLMASESQWGLAPNSQLHLLLRVDSGPGHAYYQVHLMDVAPAEEWPGWLQFNVGLSIDGMTIGPQWTPGRLYNEPIDTPTVMVRFVDRVEQYGDSVRHHIQPGVWLLTGQRGL